MIWKVDGESGEEKTQTAAVKDPVTGKLEMKKVVLCTILHKYKKYT